MEVIFIRHGSAAPGGAGGDEARQLTAEGEAEIRTTADALARLVKGIDVILTSPLARAVRTAEILAERFAAATIEPAELLAPPARPNQLRRRLDELAAGDLWAVALVGHAPSLDEYIGDLVASTTAIGLSLSKAGAACVALTPGQRPELRWLMRRETLAMLGG